MFGKNNKITPFIIFLIIAILFIFFICGPGKNIFNSNSCGDKKCGNDRCGNSCGTCSKGEICKGGQCKKIDGRCQPNCDGKHCGDDGCKGTCGECSDDESCNVDGQCVPICQPDCDDINCGEDDGCGGICGCDDGSNCYDGKCCTPSGCDGTQCGTDHCGGRCQCNDGYTCSNYKCVCDTSPLCADNTCIGEDGCGNACGCDDGYTCNNGICVPIICQPVCDDINCGEADGCGGICGCEDGYTCNIGICVPIICQPDCDDINCGKDDGCGGICGCEDGAKCYDGKCCTPSGCDGTQCGTDNCGGRCQCNDGYTCSNYKCVCDTSPLCADNTCIGEDGCGNSCGCDDGYTCTNGECVQDSVIYVKTDSSAYGFGSIITCTWNTPPGDDYTYNISIIDNDGNTVANSECDGNTDTSFNYKVYKFSPPSIMCSSEDFGVQLDSGNNYYINVVSCDVNENCDNGVNSNAFSIVECVISGSGVDQGNCNTSSETSLLAGNPYARSIYELQCSYADDVEACMGQYYPTANFDVREIPSVCLPLSDGSENVCSRAVCPPMSVPFTDANNITYAGCTAPYNDQYPNPPSNNIFQSGLYFSYKPEVTSYAANYSAAPSNDDTQFAYGYPFIAIIEGGSDPNDDGEPIYNASYQINFNSTSERIAVPGMTGYDNNIYIMPMPINNFHPFMAWMTFSQIDNDYNPIGGFREGTSGPTPGCNIAGYNMYHIGLDMFLDNNTDKCHATSGDNGVICTPYMNTMNNIAYFTQGDNEDNITCSFQPTAGGSNSTKNPCFVSNIWLDKVDAEFPSATDVNISVTFPKYTGSSCSNGDYSDCSNNWNAPVSNGNDRQSMIFFGADTDDVGMLYHRDNNGDNKISHMRRWVINQNNNYFWPKGLGAGDNNTGTYGSTAVYQSLAAQWPNGPPYSDSSKRIESIYFSAPIQYGIAPMNQKDFLLEAYTWNLDYSSFDGLGFITGYDATSEPSYRGALINGSGVTYMWAIDCDFSENEGCNQWPTRDITEMYTTSANFSNGSRVYMSFISDGNNDSHYGFILSTTPMTQDGSGGVIIFWPNGCVYLTNDANPGNKYWLCVDNVNSNLEWINLESGSSYSNSFTPLMLAMSWTT